MAAPIATIQCANPECRVSETGKCVEGHEKLDQCGFYGKPKGVVTNDDEPGRQVLPSADRLTSASVTKALRASESRMIAIVASFDSGKTSLIAGIYDLFQLGPIGDLWFGGSGTLHAFESACHHSRVASRREEPDMNRTPRSGVNFYHLQVGTITAPASCAILLADRAGEEYRAILDEPTASRTLSEIARADSLCLLVDGKRLLDAGERHNLRSELELLVKAMVDTRAARPGQHLSIVLTKLDEVQSSDYAERAERDFQTIVSNVCKRHQADFGSVTAFRVAASPKKRIVPRGTGLKELLAHWVSASIPELPLRPRATTPNRAFGRLRNPDAH